MSNVDIKSMFDSIKESLNNEKKNTGGSFRDIMKLTVGNTYLVRLIPNVKDPANTFFHYFHHGWTSNETGQYVDAICPTTWGERCPICEERFRLYKKGGDKNKELSKLIRRMEKHFVNIFVVQDPVNEENNNKIKVLRFGIRIKEKFDAAIEGDDAAEFGSRVFDLSENGCNFKIKVESAQDGNKKFSNYNNSRFTAPSAIPSMTPEKMKEVYESIFDLSTYIEKSTTEGLKNMLATHLYCDKAAVAKTEETTETETTEPVIAKEKAPASKISNDDKIQELLEGLDNVGN